MKRKLRHEKTQNMEVYSYLNIRDRELGKLYKETGKNPLPRDFVLTEEVVQEALQIGQMKNRRWTIPFGAENKSFIQKKEKLSQKNTNKILGYLPNIPYSEEFSKKLDTYLHLRSCLTDQLFKNAKSQDFDEIEVFRRIHNLNPVFAELLEFGENENEGLFAQKLAPVLNGLEEKYHALYNKKLKEIQQKNNRKSQKQVQKQATINLEKSKVLAEEAQIQAEEKKRRDNKASAEKIRQEMKTANAITKKNKDKK